MTQSTSQDTTANMISNGSSPGSGLTNLAQAATSTITGVSEPTAPPSVPRDSGRVSRPNRPRSDRRAPSRGFHLVINNPTDNEIQALKSLDGVLHMVVGHEHLTEGPLTFRWLSG